MTEVTRILSQIESGDPSAAEKLLPLVYEELRRLAVAKLAHEKPGQTLQATALVHEAYLRLVDVEKVQRWNSRGHFFGAAAEAMRRILVEMARRKQSQKAGGEFQKIELSEIAAEIKDEPIDLLILDEALRRLEVADPEAALIIKLRFFSGLSMDQAAAAAGMSPRTAYYTWTYARAWLKKELQSEPSWNDSSL